MRTLIHGLKRILSSPVAAELAQLQRTVEAQLLLAARGESRRVRGVGPVQNLREIEFRVFSQWGEDGILQYLLGRVPVARDFFVELGVQDYREANTRLLLIQDDWRGVVVDADAAYVDAIRRDDAYWRHDLQAVCRFLTRENVNQVLRSAGAEGDIGVLSIDLDGNDYWVWEAIDAVRPRIVVCEYNSVFGRGAVTVPYRADFQRTRAHPSNLYFGASLAALCRLAKSKGYVCVGSNSAGSNAFFVLAEYAGGVRAVTADEGYVQSRARESRDAHGRLTHASGAERAELIRELPLVDLERDAVVPVAQALR